MSFFAQTPLFQFNSNQPELNSTTAFGGIRQKRKASEFEMEMMATDVGAAGGYECWESQAKRLHSSDSAITLSTSAVPAFSAAPTPVFPPTTPTHWFSHQQLPAIVDNNDNEMMQDDSGLIMAMMMEGQQQQIDRLIEERPRSYAALNSARGDCEYCRAGSQGHLQHIWMMQRQQQQQIDSMQC